MPSGRDVDNGPGSGLHGIDSSSLIALIYRCCMPLSIFTA